MGSVSFVFLSLCNPQQHKQQAKQIQSFHHGMFEATEVAMCYSKLWENTQQAL